MARPWRDSGLLEGIGTGNMQVTKQTVRILGIAIAQLAIFSLVFGAANLSHAFQKESSLPDSWSEKVAWRSIGPANMSGRITAVAVYEGDSNIWWAASAAGGLLKTVNNGVNFEHQFDDQATVSIGDVQVSKTDPNVLWVGTGESNPRNSVSWGDGVYKSVDGGKTWKNMGLGKTFQIGRIAIHPEDHDIVYVGALGRLWGPNEERGLFKTIDGGKTWEKVFYIDDKTGVVDVQMNHDNPDELFIATYERMRDGFDGNDPVKKYGAGSGIYKTTNAGKSFTRLSQGLPSCNLGRVGLSIYRKDPTHLVAIVESEKIAKEPTNVAYAGLRGENADVGAKITSVVKDGPSEKGGLKEDDIVISVNGEIVHSYNDLLAEFRKNKAGDTIKVLVSRDRKPMDLTIELAKKPQRGNRQRRQGRGGRGQTARTPFTGTLGGQAANLQGQQGENEHEYGGVYLSKDSGDSWERINTLNPRPMYYSQIRIDPTDINNMYVLGTSLYKSKDGGKTFTGDGGSDGIHVDHHALWIDPQDSRHMILGNDGGLYVTHDRMEHWDHHNHVAIGQFYHVTVGPNRDYNVYGGLQDNGSWGGPSRVGNDSGIVNTDWFRVGGGDGFICQVDPADADQIYFESQNGGMGRINLRTGERGFIRPRPPRGTRYRFNWKTPYILSPHNSKIHYSAGNHVFRSYNKGAGVKAISPEITNTNKGAGSAITESPVQAGVLYAGTTDGALWMTKDSGQTWTALYSTKKKKDGGKKSEGGPDQVAQVDGNLKNTFKKDAADAAKTEAAESADSPKTETSKGDADKDPAKKDPLTGVWVGQMTSDRFPQGQAPSITFTLKLGDDGKVEGELETRRGPQEITEASFNSETGELSLMIEGRRGSRTYTATVKGEKMTGEMSSSRFEIEFEATRQRDPGNSEPDKSVSKMSEALLVNQSNFAAVLLAGVLTGDRQENDDPVSGTWNAVVENAQLPGGQIEFTVELKLDKENGITGTIESSRGKMDILDGEYQPKRKTLYFFAENDRNVTIDFEAKIDGKSMKGDVSINDGRLNAELEATQTESGTKKGDDNSAESDANAKQSESAQEEQPARERGFLGITLGTDSDLEIRTVTENFAAAKAGIKAGDKITSLGGEAVSEYADLRNRLSKFYAGDKIEVVVDRDGSAKTFSVVLDGQGRLIQATQQAPQQALQAEKQEDQETTDDKDKQSISDDPISGTWTGTMTSRRGDRDMTITLVRKSDKEITGSYETATSERDFDEGKFDPKTNMLTLVAETENFTLEFNGEIKSDTYTGQIDFNSGQFEMEFEVSRTGKPKTGVASSQTAKGATDAKKSKGKSLADLMPGPRWVSSLHASKYKASRCYATFDGHRSNDDLPHLYVSENYGETWQSIRGNLPLNAGSARVLREDIVNDNLLYLGCEFGAWASIDRGKTWTKFKNLPTVAVHEIAIHPTAGEIVAATHGRSLWIADVSMLRQVTPEKISSNSELYKPRNIVKWQSGARRGSSGTRRFVGENPASSVSISYSLGKNARTVELTITNIKGDTVKRFEELSSTKGIHQLLWDLRSSGSRGRFGPRTVAGQYMVNLRVDGEKHTQVLTIENDPSMSSDAVAADEELEFWLEAGIDD